MKAAVLHGPHDIRIEDVPEPEVTPDGIIIKVKNCGVCGSDLHPYKTSSDKVILGHEASGDVVAVGENVTHLKEGDRVAGIGIKPCGWCHWCQQGDLGRCIYTQWQGSPPNEGSFAEYALIPHVRFGDWVTAVKLPDSMSYEQGATIEPLSIAKFSIDRIGVKPDDTVVIIGAGTIGLLCLEVCRAIGVKSIVVSGRRSNRLQLARDGGASVVVDAATEDALTAIQGFTSGAGADVVLECAGVQDTFDQSIAALGKSGRVAMIGMFEQPVNWTPNYAIYKNITFVGCLGEDLPGALDLLSTGKASTEQLVTHRFGLDDTKEALETAITADDAVKVMVEIA